MTHRPGRVASGLESLPWLPDRPDDFAERLSAARAALDRDPPDGSAAWTTLRHLAAHALDETDLVRLARVLSGWPAAAEVPARETLAIVGDGTLALLAEPILASALRHGLRLHAVVGGFGCAVAEALDPGSRVHAAGADMALLAFDSRSLGLDGFEPSDERARASVDRAFETIRDAAAGLRRSVRGPLFVQTLAPDFAPTLGSLDRAHAGSAPARVAALNDRLVAWSRSGEVVPIDVATLAAAVGLDRWHDPVHWFQSKLPFCPDFVPLYADFVARTIGAARGHSKKCLVLDLDDTLWGGLVGDDGVEGLALGAGSGRGEAFLGVQRMALDFHARGVILAVCSKNDDATARRPFREHPEMLLREEHVAAFHAGWADKAEVLPVIADELGIGLDALVLLDDNPAERSRVRDALPMVAVPELPPDPALFPRVVRAAGYFEAVSFGDEDRARAGSYAARAALQTLARSPAPDLDAHLRSLEMVLTIDAFDERGRARIAQLVNKSNQFNLTTRRRSEAEISALMADPRFHLMQVRLADRFADHGVICVLAAEKAAPEWEIETWVMSCRVFQRRVEEAVLGSLVASARRAGAARLSGRYVPSGRNAIVADLYPRLGFARVADQAGATRWQLELGAWAAQPLPIRVIDHLTGATP